MKRTARFIALAALCAVALLLLSAAGFTAPQAIAANYSHALCSQNSSLCTEVADSLNYNGIYTGHDEPSVLFYSNTAGSGNNSTYVLTLPKDPPTLPKQDGTGGTFNFQLHPAFWFGMAMCDSQSSPNPGAPCAADTDANIFDSANPTAPDYIGKHPGTAFMEMQFYPPGWAPWPAGNSCDAFKWCAALNIDSLSQNPNTGQNLNLTCQSLVGIEYVNFAFITKNGVAQAPANPVQSTLGTFTPDPNKDLFMNSGDQLVVSLHDTAHGFQVVIKDLTTGETGSMTASAANSFGQVQFAPTGTACNNIPYDFHPMYSTSSEHTRVPWAAHSYNVAFSDEIGHFEYCGQESNGNCVKAGANDPGGLDADDVGCFGPDDSTRVRIAGCLGTDVDFDGVPYQNTWPGTLANAGQNRVMNPTSVLFSSPTFNGGQNYARVAFEADLPRIEFATNPPCNRTTGANCVNPPAGANFYPFFTTRNSDDTGCAWQLGGANIPGTKNTFGGSSTAEYGPLLLLAYPTVGNHAVMRYNNFRQVLSDNPCPATGGS
ncbi:MAG TPA: hypothetical protein VF932_01115 [Anaerolineae bacterium]